MTSIVGAQSALSIPACSLWPYKIVSQLLDRLVKKGVVNLQTNTAVTAVSNAGDQQMIHTHRGSIRTRRIVFATNALTSGILNAYRNVIVPTKATAAHISPAQPIASHLSHTYNIHYAPAHSDRVDYLNPRPNGGIVVGGAKYTYASDRASWYNNWDDSTLIEAARSHFDGLMQRHFRGWENSGANVYYL